MAKEEAIFPFLLDCSSLSVRLCFSASCCLSVLYVASVGGAVPWVPQGVFLRGPVCSSRVVDKRMLLQVEPQAKSGDRSQMNCSRSNVLSAACPCVRL